MIPMLVYSLAAMVLAGADEDEGGDSVVSELNGAQKRFEQGDYAQAALDAYALAKAPGNEKVAAGAYLLTGKALYRAGLPQSALWAFSTLLKNQAAEPKYASKGLEWLVFISRKTQNKQAVLDEIVTVPSTQFPARYRGELMTLLASYHAALGVEYEGLDQPGEALREFQEAKALAAQVASGDKFYAQAKYVDGVVAFRNGKLGESVESFKEAIRGSRTVGKTKAEEAERNRFRDLTFMELARAHYGQKQLRNALAYYGKVQRGGDQWLESLFEGSWAAFRQGADERALGNLVTLSSPFFVNEYYPEAQLIRAIIYYENCRFGDARKSVEDFERLYAPVAAQLNALTESNAEGADFYKLLTSVESGEVVDRVVSAAMGSRGVKESLGSVREIESELAKWNEGADSVRYSDLAQVLTAELKQRVERLKSKVGRQARRRLQFESAELKRLTADSLRIKFEIADLEKVGLEAKLGGKNKDGKKLVEYDFQTEAAEDDVYWPLNDEYWRDELGTYLYTLTQGCAEHRTNVSAEEKSH